MMAHEVPINLQPPTGPKQPKGKQHYPVRKLPNGSMPDFGSGSDRNEKSTPKGEAGAQKQKGQNAANGEKSEGQGKKKGKKGAKKDANKQVQVATPEAGEGKKAKNKKNAVANVKSEEGYAGSSFHSSPEALALPKPSFKTSPKNKQIQAPAEAKAAAPQVQPPQVQAPPVSQSPHSVPPSRESPAQQNYARPMPMAMPFVYQGMPPQGPPQYPVVAHPQGMAQGPGTNMYQPGFNYTVNPQGFINYHYPPGAVPPQHPLGMSAFGYPPNMQPPMMAPMPNQPVAQTPPAHVEGRKITFNELMGSSK